MEREPPEVARRLMRAARSLNYNRELQPLIEERIDRAEGTLRGYLLANGQTALRLGAFRVEMDEDGGIELTRLPMDEWRQMPLPQLSRDRQRGSGSLGPGTAMVSKVKVGELERQDGVSDRKSGGVVYERVRET